MNKKENIIKAYNEMKSYNPDAKEIKKLLTEFVTANKE